MFKYWDSVLFETKEWSPSCVKLLLNNLPFLQLALSHLSSHSTYVSRIDLTR